jgi:hypothetical protein
MKIGKQIKIIRSVALQEMQLNALAGRTAVVVKPQYYSGGLVKGCWVKLDGEPFQGEKEWYVPYSAVIE